MFAPRTATAAFSAVVALAAVAVLAVPGALPAAASAAQAATVRPASAGPAAVPSAASTGATRVIVQMFDWPWPAIGAECTNVLGPDGYGAVQISPPEEAVVLAADGYPWWQAYQPVSYSLNSRFGTEAQLASMISACHAAGVKVYADVVLNHMTGQANGGVGDDGTTFPDMFDYPPLYSESDFHSCHASITGWHNAAGVAPVANWWSDGSNAIAFSRGAAAWVAINAESAPVTGDFSTGLPAGTYCDVISGVAAAGGCTGGTVTVNAAGQATVTVPAMGAVGIDVDAVASAAAVAETVTVTVPADTDASGDTVYLAGNLSVLGLGQSDWAPNGIPMTRLNATTWSATVEAAADTTLSYKYDLGGSWSNVEETASCGYVANRSMAVNGGTVSDTVAAWAGFGGC